MSVCALLIAYHSRPARGANGNGNAVHIAKAARPRSPERGGDGGGTGLRGTGSGSVHCGHEGLRLSQGSSQESMPESSLAPLPPPAAEDAPPINTGTAVWECMLMGQFQPYSPDAKAALEEAFQRGLETATCVVHGHVYEVGPLRAAALASGSARQRLMSAVGARSRAVRRREA